jgi:hypothetical protein
MTEGRKASLFKACLASPRSRILISCLAGGITYGLWALHINGGLSSSDARRAAIVQGLYSVLVTACFSSMMEWLMIVLNQGRRFLSVIIPCSLLFFLSYSVHLINQTPKPFLTLLPSFLMSVITTIGYVFVIEKTESR